MTGYIKFETADGNVFDVNPDILECSETFKAMIECCPKNDENMVIPLPYLRGEIFKKVLLWAGYHYYAKQRKQIYKMVDNVAFFETRKISLWNFNFLSIRRSLVYELLIAADFLQIAELVQIICHYLCLTINDKTPEQIMITLYKPKEDELETKNKNQIGEEKELDRNKEIDETETTEGFQVDKERKEINAIRREMYHKYNVTEISELF